MSLCLCLLGGLLGCPTSSTAKFALGWGHAQRQRTRRNLESGRNLASEAGVTMGLGQRLFAEAGSSLTGLGYSGANTVQLSLSVSSVTSTALHKEKHALNIHGNRGAHIQESKSCHQMEKSLSGNMTGAPSVLQGRGEQVAAPSEGRPKDSITPGRPATHMALGPAVINNQRHADRSLTRRTTLQSATGPPL